MKVLFLSFLVTMTACSTNQYQATNNRAIASVSSKIRFFETKLNKEGKSTKLECHSTECRYVEIELRENLLSISSCKIDREELFDGKNPLVSTKARDLNGDCDRYASDFEVTPQMIQALQEQASKKDVNIHSASGIWKAGSQTAGFGLMTLAAGAFSVGFAEIPATWFLFPVMTVGYAGATISNTRYLAKEIQGGTAPIYKTGSKSEVLAALSNSEVSVFYVGTAYESSSKKILDVFSPNEYTRFASEWKRFSYKLEVMKNAQYEQNNYFNGHGSPL